MHLIDTLSKFFNFSYEIINCNNNWGTKLANNTWNGLIGLLTKEVSMRDSDASNWN